MSIEAEILSQIQQYVNIPYLGTFILLSYLVKKHFEKWLMKVTKQKFKTVYVVLIIAALTGLVFWLFDQDLFWHQILLTYAIGTSMHETIFEYFEKKIRKQDANN